MNHKGTKTIETSRLLLRKFTADDAAASYRNWTSDFDVTKFLRWPVHADVTVTDEIIRKWISEYKNPDFYQWAIVLKSINEPIGTISVVGKNDLLDIIHIGYCIGSKWWHQGIMTEAFLSIIPYLFLEVGANRIESSHDPANPYSGAVMKKCGLTYEGTLRQADYNNTGIVDSCVYGLLKSDFDKKQS